MRGESEPSNIKAASYVFLDFRLDTSQGLLFRGDKELSLRPKSFETLRYLVSSGGRLVTRAELMEEVWGDVAVTDESITKCIADIRKVLDDESQAIIRTVKGRGILFQAEVRITPADVPHVVAIESPAPEAIVSTLSTQASWSRWRWLASGALVLAVAVAAYWYVGRRSKSPQLHSIVILPFVNMSGDPNEEYLSDGITEETTNAVASVKELRVVARTSAFQFKGKAQDIRKIGQQVGADAVVEGSVRREGERLRITAQLNTVRDGFHLWSRTWDRETKDLFSVEREIAQGVAQTVKRSAEGLPPSRSAPKNPAAYNFYLRGEYAFRQGDADHLARAIQFHEKAVALDPEFAPAYAALGVAYFFTVGNLQKTSREAYPKVREYVRKALMLDDTLAVAQLAQNLTCLMYDDQHQVDLKAGEQAVLRAIELDPSFKDAYGVHGNYLTLLGRKQESIDAYKVAMQLDPLDLQVAADAASNYIDNHEFERAIQTAQAVLEIDPHYFPALGDLEQAYEAAGRVKDSLELQERNNMHSASMLAAKRAAFDRNGAAGYWKASVAAWAPGGEPKYPFSTILVALAYGYLRDTESCLKWIERAYAERSPNLVWMKTTYAFDYLHGNPRFEAVARKIGLP